MSYYGTMSYYGKSYFAELPMCVVKAHQDFSMTFYRDSFLAGKPISLIEPGLTILRARNASETKLMWYCMITGTIQQESYKLWRLHGEDPYVDSISLWAKQFYNEVCRQEQADLEGFMHVLDENFRPAHYWSQQVTPKYKRRQYRKISLFKWKQYASVPAVM